MAAHHWMPTRSSRSSTPLPDHPPVDAWPAQSSTPIPARTPAIAEAGSPEADSVASLVAPPVHIGLFDELLPRERLRFAATVERSALLNGLLPTPRRPHPTVPDTHPAFHAPTRVPETHTAHQSRPRDHPALRALPAVPEHHQ